jgi:hypothetical protein
VLSGYLIFSYPSDPVFTKKLQKLSVLFLKKKTYTPGPGINYFLKKLFSSYNVGSHKFENSRSSFGGSRQSVITLFSNK